MCLKVILEHTWVGNRATPLLCSSSNISFCVHHLSVYMKWLVKLLNNAQTQSYLCGGKKRYFQYLSYSIYQHNIMHWNSYSSISEKCKYQVYFHPIKLKSRKKKSFQCHISSCLFFPAGFFFVYVLALWFMIDSRFFGFIKIHLQIFTWNTSESFSVLLPNWKHVNLKFQKKSWGSENEVWR